MCSLHLRLSARSSNVYAYQIFSSLGRASLGPRCQEGRGYLSSTCQMSGTSHPLKDLLLAKPLACEEKVRTGLGWS